MRVLLADLGHDQITISSDVYPLGVANLAVWAQVYARLDEPLEIAIVRAPLELKKQLEAGVPDVLGLSSYAWNHELSMRFAAFAKRLRPDVLTLMGGPSWPLTEGEQASYLRSLEPIDVFVQGPTYEGERAFTNVLERYAAVGKSLRGLRQVPVDGAFWIGEGGELVHGAPVPRIVDLDDIPSPYLAGLLDPYFATGLFPMMQISRGCPFTCTFCNSAVASNSKIHRHSVDNVKADLRYVAERVEPEIPLCLADDNFGMYPWDEEVADFLPELQARYDWPRYIRTTTGKNRHERIIRVMRKTGGILPMTAAVQSMSPVVMKNIERSNIKLEAYAEIQKEVLAQGMQSYGELIICLPGETKESFMRSVEQLLDAGVKRVSAHQLMLLHGAPLANPESRERWGFETFFRVVARNIGDYGLGAPVVEVEEIVAQTPTFSFEEYLEARVFHLLLTVFYYEGNFEEAFAFAESRGVKPFDVVVRLHELLPRAPAAVRELFDDFIAESRQELFESKEACIAWAQENYDALVEGSLGGNLLSKYSMIGRFLALQDALDFLEAGIASFAAADEDSAPRQAVLDYLRTVMLHTPFRDVLSKAPAWHSAYDVEGWREAGYEQPLEHYCFSAERTFATRVEPERKRLIESRIATFGEHPTGLGKFTRTMFARDLRRTVVASAELS